MKTLLSLLSLFPMIFVLACAAPGGDCESTVTEWTCLNGDCTCDEDDSSCTDPDLTDASDADNCDNACEFCAD